MLEITAPTADKNEAKRSIYDRQLLQAFVLLRDGHCVREVGDRTKIRTNLIGGVIAPVLLREKQMTSLMSDEEILDVLRSETDRYRREHANALSRNRFHRLAVEENLKFLHRLQDELNFGDNILTEACSLREGRICVGVGSLKEQNELALAAACILKAVDNLRIKEIGNGATSVTELITPLQAYEAFRGIKTISQSFGRVIRSVDPKLVVRNAVAYVSEDIERACSELKKTGMGSPDERLSLARTVENEAKELLGRYIQESLGGRSDVIRETYIISGTLASTCVIKAYKKHCSDDLVFSSTCRVLNINKVLLYYKPIFS